MHIMLLCLCISLVSALYARHNARYGPAQFCSQRACSLAVREQPRRPQDCAGKALAFCQTCSAETRFTHRHSMRKHWPSSFNTSFPPSKGSI